MFLYIPRLCIHCVSNMVLYIPIIWFYRCPGHLIIVLTTFLIHLLNSNSMDSYIHFCVYHQWVCCLGFNIYYWISVRVTKHEFIIEGLGENCSFQNLCPHLFMYILHNIVLISICEFIYIVLMCYIVSQMISSLSWVNRYVGIRQY